LYCTVLPSIEGVSLCAGTGASGVPFSTVRRGSSAGSGEVICATSQQAFIFQPGGFQENGAVL
jgi:hypothetical protein